MLRRSFVLALALISMLASDFRVNGKVVEFGLRLPDGRRLPIDSKWTAVAELEAMEAEEDPTRRDACARRVEKAVASLSEHRRYLELLSDTPVEEQTRQIVDMATLGEEGERRVGFRLYWG